MDNELQTALEHIVAHFNTKRVPKRLAGAVKVIMQRLAEVHREQQVENDIIAATAEFWRENMHDKDGRPIPVDKELIKEAVQWALRENDEDEETTVEEVIRRAACLRDSTAYLNRPEVRRQVEGFTAISGWEFEEFVSDETTH